MAKLRRFWSTTLRPDERRRHESKVEAYRYVRGDAANRAANPEHPQYVRVWVDERDGHGWQLYEEVDLDEVGAW